VAENKKAGKKNRNDASVTQIHVPKIKKEMKMNAQRIIFTL
jgi:hypothetical protein